MAAAATLTPDMSPGVGVVTPSLPPFSLCLPFRLDVSYPVSIPSRSTASTTQQWLLPVAGPASAPDESLDGYVTRRYHEAVYLGEVLAPLGALVSDWQRVASAHGEAFAAAAERLIVPMTTVEKRHRRTYAPVVTSLLGGTTVPGAQAKLDAAVEEAGLDSAERGVMEAGVELRLTSRAVADGRTLSARAMSEEFELRETMVQLLLLLIYRASPHRASERIDANDNDAPRKKRKKRRSSPSPQASPIEDRDAALQILAGKITVFQLMGDLVLASPVKDPKGKGKARVEEGPKAAVAALWTVMTCFLPREAKFLSSFHRTVFGTEIAPELVPAKKRRKPEHTHRLITDPGRLRRTASTISASASAPPSAVPMGRTSSRMSAGASSPRSASILLDSGPEPKRHRQFKARDAPVLKRASSMAVRAGRSKEEKERRQSGEGQSQGQSQSQSQLAPARSGSGMFGILKRTSSQSQSQSQSRLARSQSQPQAIVQETPARGLSNPFARRPVHHPTPIREEPSSAARSERSSYQPSLVAETPVANRTISRDTTFIGERPSGPSFGQETPVARRLGLALVEETPAAQRTVAFVSATPGVGESDDEFAELMVPTDDEGSP